MIPKQHHTCLVLGAGVSLPYGYPSGQGLVDLIKGKLNKQNVFEFQIFQDLTDLQPRSIDAFLRNRPDYQDVVKPIIAEILFEKEDTAAFESVAPEDHFYRYFFESIEDKDLSNFSIISFNYDRSLEFYLARAFRAKDGKGGTKSFERFKSLRIEHIHGRLSELPEGEGKFKNSKSDQPIGYGNYRKLRERLKGQPFCYDEFKDQIGHHGRNSFRTIYENNDQNKDATALLNNSDRILFLGFGFHSLNMKIIGFRDSSSFSDKTIAGTCFNVPPTELRLLKKIYPQLSKLTACRTVTFFNDKCSLADHSIDEF